MSARIPECGPMTGNSCPYRGWATSKITAAMSKDDEINKWRARAIELESLLKDALVFVERAMKDTDPDIATQADWLCEAIRSRLL